MNYSYLLFRCNQVGRYIQRTGILYIVLPLFLLSGVLLQGMENLILLTDFHLVLLYAFVLIVVLAQRTDYSFLNHTELSLPFIYLIDVGLFTIPFSILFVLLEKWPAALGVLGLGICVALLWSTIASFIDGTAKRSTSLRMDIPWIDFEMKYILRKYGLLLSFFYLICLVFSAISPIAIFVFAFVFIALFQSALEYFEPKEMIFYYDSPKQFLRSKIYRSWCNVQFFLLPFYGLGLFALFSYWYLFILIFAASSVMIFFSICNKYVFYRPSVLKYNTNVLSAIMLLFMFFPGFQLVVLFMSIVQYFKAKKNLNYYW